jgi:hypothetical protein
MIYGEIFERPQPFISLPLHTMLRFKLEDRRMADTGFYRNRTRSHRSSPLHLPRGEFHRKLRHLLNLKDGKPIPESWTRTHHSRRHNGCSHVHPHDIHASENIITQHAAPATSTASRRVRPATFRTHNVEASPLNQDSGVSALHEQLC